MIFIIFDLLNQNDQGTRSELEIIEYMRRKDYNMELFQILKNKFTIENHNYELRGIILTPQSDHFTLLILNYQNEILGLKKGVNYFYDGNTKNHKIEAVTSLENVLKSNIVYLGIYLEYN